MCPAGTPTSRSSGRWAAIPFAEEALAAVRAAGVTLELRTVAEPTGVALILVDASGENEIVVAPGANSTLAEVELPAHDAVLCQLEVSDAAVFSAWEECTGFFCLNAAPARPVTVDPDLTVVNRWELESLSRRDGLVAVTLGAEGAMLLEDGEEIARAAPPTVEAVDGTAAGDAFTACLLVSLLGGREPGESLERACAAGAIAASRIRSAAFATDRGRDRRDPRPRRSSRARPRDASARRSDSSPRSSRTEPWPSRPSPATAR